MVQRGDALVVSWLDRLRRSLRHLFDVVADMERQRQMIRQVCCIDWS
jgi:DNA invertase Pin-like site-specific DNA recombinase